MKYVEPNRRTAVAWNAKPLLLSLKIHTWPLIATPVQQLLPVMAGMLRREGIFMKTEVIFCFHNNEVFTIRKGLSARHK
jgi:hypothetical protein